MPNPERTLGVASSYIDADVIEHKSGGTVGFYGVTPIAQRTGSAQATFTITIGTSETNWGFKTSDQFNAFVLQLRELQNTMIALGIWAGS